MPYISVIITAYNRKQFLLDAIKSALNQTLNRTEYEILVAKNFKDDNIDNYLYKNGMKNINIIRSIKPG
ncbi:glycosyltransferase family 2 protein [Saccharolobus islandicus]|uniref:Glycosyltransferase n=1 Tax=Saccharolobus islandicus (strain M.16.27) TaxID=427318 RepID=C3N380_SACI3|nr:glycosyltransferase [Sulfolobus islandicus]ACP54591.1 glycosyltransferase [Sulfolobus islandicus M.16.27]